MGELLMSSFIDYLKTAKDGLDPQYRAHYLKEDARQTSIAIAIWLIPLLLFGLTDYSYFGSNPQLALSLVIRIALFIFSLYTISALLKVTTVRNYDFIFLRWAAFAVVAVLYFNYSWASRVPLNGAITVLILISAYMAFPTSLLVRLALPIALSVGNLALHWTIAESVNPYSRFSMFVAIIMANILGIIFSTALEFHRRTEFKARLEEARFKEELSRLASIDALTGIYNRRKLMQLATEEFERFHSGNQPFSVLMIDIDHFKELNDSYGHGAGDLILVNFAAYIADNIQKDYIWGRLGGDEFLLVLPNIDRKQAIGIAEKFRHGLHKKSVNWQGEQLSISITIGLTETTRQDHSLDDVLKRADKALYSAKRSGRNRTEIL
jgi:diguanylate cyclase (GGDEF)-like protein